MNFRLLVFIRKFIKILVNLKEKKKKNKKKEKKKRKIPIKSAF